MKKAKNKAIVVLLGLIVLILPLTASWAMEHPTATPAKPVSLEQLYQQQLPLLAKALESTQKAMEMGHKDHALMELKKAQELLTVLQQGLAQHVKPAFVNTVCPIMGSKIDPTKVTPALTREFHGQKVAFCCAGCPTQWDKLSDSEKQAKLMKVTADHNMKKH